jgi:hypothetical protein
MREKWLIFKDRQTGRELCAYTLRGTFAEERQETIALLAAEENIPEDQIEAYTEDRPASAS